MGACLSTQEFTFTFSLCYSARNFSSTATREAGLVQHGICLIFPKCCSFLKRKNNTKNFTMKDWRWWFLEWLVQYAGKLQQNIIELRAVIVFEKLFHSLAHLRISCSKVLTQREFLVIPKRKKSTGGGGSMAETSYSTDGDCAGSAANWLSLQKQKNPNQIHW